MQLCLSKIAPGSRVFRERLCPGDHYQAPDLNNLMYCVANVKFQSLMILDSTPRTVGLVAFLRDQNVIVEGCGEGFVYQAHQVIVKSSVKSLTANMDDSCDRGL